VSVSVPRQRRGRGAVSVLVRTGTPAQVRLRIRVGGRLVGEDVAPILSSRRERVTVRVPRRLRGRTLVVQARMRDLVGVTASATARGRLR
jgi:hypothetical protein